MALSAIMAGVGGAAQVANSIFSIVAANKMKKEANKIRPTWDYRQSDDAAQMKGFAQMRLNARNPYSEANRRGVLSSQAGMNAAAQRNAIDPSQLLAMAAASQGQADQSMFNAGMQDLQFNQMNTGNYMNALQTGVQQDNIQNQFMANKFQMDQDRKDSLMSASRQSVSNALSNLSSSAMSAAKGGSQGMFGNTQLWTGGQKAGGLNAGQVGGLAMGALMRD